MSCCIPLPDLIGSSHGNVYIKGGKIEAKSLQNGAVLTHAKTQAVQTNVQKFEQQIDQTKAVSGRPPGHQACNPS